MRAASGLPRANGGRDFAFVAKTGRQPQKADPIWDREPITGTTVSNRGALATDLQWVLCGVDNDVVRKRATFLWCLASGALTRTLVTRSGLSIARWRALVNQGRQLAPHFGQ